MNVEINAINFPLIYTLPNDDSTNLDMMPEPTNVIFVHVQNKATQEAPFPTLQNEGWYICVLYVHAADCIGRFIVPCSKVSEWTAQSKIRVFISAADSLTKTIAKSSKLATVKDQSPKVTSTANVRALALKYISVLKKVWDKRHLQQEEQWDESRLLRVTGTSAKFVMRPKPATDRQVAQVFGLCPFTPTTQMQIGSILEQKILAVYCKHEQLQLHKTRGGQTLQLLHGYKYVGHTPDGRTIKTTVETMVLEVKVIFTKIDLTAQLQKHIHQLQLGLWVHHCNEGRLIVYQAPSDMTIAQAETYEIDRVRMEATSFTKDYAWRAKFKQNVQIFFEDHLQWFYAEDLDMEKLKCKVEGLLTSLRQDKSSSSDRAVNKRKRNDID
jgi:hypothetical protein